MSPSALVNARREMLKTQLVSRGIDDQKVLSAMARIPREVFVPPHLAADAYADNPLPVGCGQTISQPYIVAAMVQTAQIAPGSRVLEVGTGSGYAAAVLAEIAFKVFTIERLPELAEFGETNLRRAGYGPERVQVRRGDGYEGWPEEAPFAAILVAAAAPEVPQILLEQLQIGAFLIVPVQHSDGGEMLERWHRRSALHYDREELFPVRFVPLVHNS